MAHPIHPAIVHFPIACWSLATFTSGLQWAFDIGILQVAPLLMVVGLIFGVVAMLAGLIELVKIDESNKTLLTLAYAHMAMASTAWFLYGVSTYLHWQGGNIVASTGLSFSFSVAGFIALAIAGFLGGQLVYGYGIGVQK